MADRNNNNSRMVSDHSTAGTSRTHDSTGVSWTNYSGTKGSHDVNANQINSKNSNGDHTFYSPKTGVQGWAGGNRKK